ncbi:serine/threonine-protein phosphatase 2A 65 kDa regulatory subunit A beta isoform [Tanacetum coccineum]
MASSLPEMLRARRNCFDLAGIASSSPELLPVHDWMRMNFRVMIWLMQSNKGKESVQGTVDYGRWRVRYMVANQQYELCEAVGSEPTKTDLVPAYVRLLHDNEAEVRIAAAGKVTKFSRILDPELAIQHIAPFVKELSSDSSQHVMSALAFVIMGVRYGRVLEIYYLP